MAQPLTPQETANQFIEAVIRNDLDTVGELSGLHAKNGRSPAEQIFGQAIAAAIRADIRKQARNPDDYRWSVGDCAEPSSGSRCDMRVELFMPDTIAIARKIETYMGDVIGSDGSLHMADPPLMSASEAEAKAVKETPPLRYRVPLMTEKQGDAWYISAPSEEYTVLVDIINKGNILTKNEQYRVR